LIGKRNQFAPQVGEGHKGRRRFFTKLAVFCKVKSRPVMIRSTISLMRLTILGSGTVVPNGERNSSGYFVEAGETRLMMDCGAGTLHALARYGLDWERLTHIFLSHFHVDHIGELASLFMAFRHGLKQPRTEPLTLIAPRGIERVIGHLKQAFGEKLFTPKFTFDLIGVEPGESLQLNDHCTLSVAKTPHTDESLAVRIEDRGRVLCYTGDTGPCEDLARFFYEADLLISECSFRETKEGVPHLAISDVAHLASQAKARKLIVTHFYFEVDEAALKTALRNLYAGEVLIGRDGLAVEIAS
jgi:ribonuclease BN (tRNA processing enzyme)